MKKIFTSFLALMLMMVGATASMAEIKEKVIYQTKFQDWAEVKSSTTETTVSKTTTDGKTLDFMLMETQCAPAGTNAKFTSECITPGYLMAAKTATPYIKTSAIADVTSITFVHAATGSNRGWGLKVKGDGDADWVTITDAIANPASGQEVTVNVNRKNVQLWFYNLNASQNAYMTSLKINGNVEVADRTFKPFKINFRTDPYTVVEPSTGLPEGVVVTGGSFHDGQHGYTGATLTVPVDGPVKFTIGGCGYSNKATVSVNGGAASDIATLPAGCDTNTSYDHNVVYTYNNESPATLTFNLGSYCPYFMAEACEFVPSVTVSYYNTDGKLIGEDEVAGSSELKFKYTASDVTVPAGQAFRGWFDNKDPKIAMKVAEGRELNEDLKLYAKATDIEKATVGSHYDYDITKNNWYVEDHELIDINGHYHNNHGWIVNSIQIQVAGKCYVNMKNCFYSEEQTAVVTDAAGNEVATFAGKAEADGAVASFQYDGPATTLTITYPSGAYVHGVEIYNVAEFVAFDKATGYYHLASGDTSSLMMILKTAKAGDKIYLPNGTYDLGEVCLTQVSANNVSIIGESMEGTIIRNTPLQEGIGVTATLLLTGSNIYIQDLTLQCSSEKCATPAASRCVTIQDKGTNNICKNVKLLSGQDTYYSNGSATQKAYFEDCYITGTVDYICGGGDVTFNRTTFYNLERSSGDVIVAPATDASTKWGYVMMDCTVDGHSGQDGKFNIGRDWQKSPAATWLNTTFKIMPTAAGYTNMSDTPLALRFHEYNSHKADGTVITGHNLNSLVGGSTYTPNLYLTAAQAAEYTVANIYGTWAPDQIAAQVTDVAEGTAFLVDGKITTVAPTSGKVRIANARGGFGPEVEIVAGETKEYTVTATIIGGGKTESIGEQKITVTYNSDNTKCDVTVPATTWNSWSMDATKFAGANVATAEGTTTIDGFTGSVVFKAGSISRTADVVTADSKVTITNGTLVGTIKATCEGAEFTVEYNGTGIDLPTGISAVKVARTAANGKFIDNGAIVIMKNNKKYNVAGMEIK